MKRMNLIHGLLFAVLTFMGSISLSAQAWLPPADAVPAISQALDVLEQPMQSPTKSVGSFNSLPTSGPAGKTAGCAECTDRAVKIAFLTQTGLRIKQGMPTGQAVDEVHALLIGGANGTPSLLASIATAYAFVVDLLS